MAKSIYISHLDQLEKVFKEIPNSIERIAKDTVNDKQKTSLLLAQDLAKEIEAKYINYLDNISNYEHGSKNVTVTIDDTKKGYVVKIHGKDVLYHEYGTGTRGLQSKHPRHNADGMRPYGSGQNVIQNGKKQNGSETPYWYKLYRDLPGYRVNLPNDLNNGDIRANDYVWRHNGIITKGLPAGRFVYDSCQKYRESGGLASKTVLTNTIKQAIKTDFKNRMNKVIKQRRITNKPEVRMTVSNEEFKRRALAAILSQSEGL